MWLGFLNKKNTHYVVYERSYEMRFSNNKKHEYWFELANQKRMLQERLELSTSAWLSRDKHGEGTVYKYGALTDCATGAPQ